MRNAFGYVFLWLLGVPISLLIVIWIISNLLFR